MAVIQWPDLLNREALQVNTIDHVNVVFILSDVRSGSTWLNLVLGSCSWAMSLGEYHRCWTMPDHIACRLCEADGLAECSLLRGIEHVARADAFHFAAERSGKRTLIDASKSTEWCANFLERPDIEARLIHLIRHPCGQVESQLRRDADLTPDLALEQWVQNNRKIEEFVDATSAPSRLVCYDDLADHPTAAFTELCSWLGQNWESTALDYWNVVHHGLGANGAASVFLRGREVKNYTTGEDSFYEDITTRPTAADRRWLERLSEDFRLRAKRHPYVNQIKQRLPDTWRVW